MMMENKKSVYDNIQKFKIGRIKYNLPSRITIGGGHYYLSFNYGVHEAEWFFCYRYWSGFSDATETILECHTETFNQGIKELHKRVKTLHK